MDLPTGMVVDPEEYGYSHSSEDSISSDSNSDVDSGDSDREKGLVVDPTANGEDVQEDLPTGLVVDDTA